MKPGNLTISNVLQVIALVSACFAGYMHFETRANAEDTKAELLMDREVGDLRTRIELAKVQIQRYTDLEALRSLQPHERVDLNALQTERDLLLQRLTSFGEMN